MKACRVHEGGLVLPTINRCFLNGGWLNSELLSTTCFFFAHTFFVFLLSSILFLSSSFKTANSPGNFFSLSGWFFVFEELLDWF